MPTIDDLPPDMQAKIAAAMFLAAVDEPKRKSRITIDFRDLLIGYTAVLMIAIMWVFVRQPTDWNIFVGMACIVPLVALIYAALEFGWLFLVSLVGRSIWRLLGKA
jgi:hypothetical protein